jgi:hypothetical protein
VGIGEGVGEGVGVGVGVGLMPVVVKVWMGVFAQFSALSLKNHLYWTIAPICDVRVLVTFAHDGSVEKSTAVSFTHDPVLSVEKMYWPNAVSSLKSP